MSGMSGIWEVSCARRDHREAKLFVYSSLQVCRNLLFVCTYVTVFYEIKTDLIFWWTLLQFSAGSVIRLWRSWHALFILALANRHSQSCSGTEVEGGCTCSQVSPISAACCKKFNLMNILQHCPSDFVAEPTSGHTHTTFWSHNPWNIRKNCLTSKVKMSHMQPRLARFLFSDIHRSIRIYIPLTFFFGFPEAFKVDRGRKWLQFEIKRGDSAKRELF